jgi:hypothetical protein
MDQLVVAAGRIYPAHKRILTHPNLIQMFNEITNFPARCRPSVPNSLPRVIDRDTFAFVTQTAIVPFDSKCWTMRIANESASTAPSLRRIQVR